MADNTNNKPRPRNSARAKSNKKAAPIQNNQKEGAASSDAAIKTSASSNPKRMTVTSLPLDTLICCASGVANGKLIYRSTRVNGYEVVWNEFGDEQYIELAELSAMRSQHPKFFSKNWILIDDQEALEALHATNFYHGIYSVDDVYAIFDYEPIKIREVVSSLGDGLKNSIAFIARQKYEAGELDSNSKIKAFEDATGYSISE